jgi:hypothetical protein
MTTYGRTQRVLPTSSTRLTTARSSTTIPTRAIPPPASRTANRSACSPVSGAALWSNGPAGPPVITGRFGSDNPIRAA